MGDVSRLPKWAQDHIANQQRRIDELFAKIDELSAEHTGSNVQVTSHGVYPDYSLPPDSTVDFFLGDNREKYRETIEIRHHRSDNKSLHISGQYGRLMISPVASNVVVIRLEDL